MRLKIFTIFFIFSPLFIFAQKEKSPLAKKLDDWKITTSAAMQIWATYTMGAEILDQNTAQYTEVDDRLNFQLHRSRLTIKGQPYQNIKFNITGAYDFVGQDILSGTEQPGNNGASPRIRLWNATVHWQLKPGDDRFNVTTGYFVPQMGRESITSPFRGTSFEKSWSQNYLRRHLVSTGPGRAGGLNIGGLMEQGDNFRFGYDAGIFNPAFINFGGGSGGVQHSPVVVGRAVAYFGDPEMTNYTLGHKVNYFGKRNGFSLALSAARQGESDIFMKSTAIGADFLLNWQNLNLDGEWTFLRREGEDGNDQSFSAAAAAGYLRLSLNLELKKGCVIEPVVMQVLYNGETEADEQVRASGLGMPSGEERITDFGVNFYFNPDLKFSLFYTLRNGDSGELGDPLGVNNYFFQNGVGPIRRGDFLGLGLSVVL